MIPRHHLGSSSIKGLSLRIMMAEFTKVFLSLRDFCLLVFFAQIVRGFPLAVKLV